MTGRQLKIRGIVGREAVSSPDCQNWAKAPGDVSFFDQDWQDLE